MPYNQLPGVQFGRTVTPRQVLAGTEGKIEISGTVDSSKAIDGGNTGYTNYLRGGFLMGQITSSKKWVPCKRTQVNQSSNLTGTSITVDDASAFKAGDVISVGADTTKTISSINYSTNTFTMSASFTFADNEAVVAEDGSQTARAILLDDEIQLLAQDMVTASDKSCRLLIAGFVNSGVVLGDVTNIRADATSAAYLAGIRFSGDYT